MTKNFIVTFWLALFLIFLLPASAWANLAVPIIGVTLPGMIICLVPVILIESVILKKNLPISTKQSVIGSSVSNFFSTLIGLPLSSVLHLLIATLLYALFKFSGASTIIPSSSDLEYLFSTTLGAPVLASHYRSDINIRIAMLASLIPAFFVSWWMEYLILRGLLKSVTPSELWKAVKAANLISYLFLALLVFIMLMQDVIKGSN